METSCRRKLFGYPDAFEIPGFRVALAIASLPGMTIGGWFAAEDATLTIFMMELGTANLCRAIDPQINLRCGKHANDRRNKINPQIRPMPRRHRRSESARRVHAHTRDRRFDGDVGCYQSASA